MELGWQVYLKLKPGGHLVLSVPVDTADSFHWTSMRVYGPHRLPRLLWGWEYLGTVAKGKVFNKAACTYSDRKPNPNGVPALF